MNEEHAQSPYTLNASFGTRIEVERSNRSATVSHPDGTMISFAPTVESQLVVTYAMHDNATAHLSLDFCF